MKVFIEGFTSGAIAGAVGVLTKRQFTADIAVLLVIGSFVILLKLRTKEPYIILTAVVIGLIIKALMN